MWHLLWEHSRGPGSRAGSLRECTQCQASDVNLLYIENVDTLWVQSAALE